MKTTTVLLLTASLLLTACGQQTSQQEQPDQSFSGGAAGQDNNPNDNSDPAKPVNPEAGKPEAGKPGGNNNNGSAPRKEQTASGKTPEKPTKDNIAVQYHMNKVYNIVPNDKSVPEKVVLLTFDDGPKEAKMIKPMLDTLDKHDAKAIFFVNGYRVKQNPELLKLLHDRGQIIGNHSWDHIDLRKQSKSKARKQIEDVQRIVKETIGETPKFFRPPFGSGGDAVKQITKDNGMLFMTWSNGSLDWDSKNKNKPDAVIQNVMDQLHPGSNILMHELPWTVEALDTLLTKLEKRGYSFVDPRSIDLNME